MSQSSTIFSGFQDAVDALRDLGDAFSDRPFTTLSLLIRLVDELSARSADYRRSIRLVLGLKILTFVVFLFSFLTSMYLWAFPPNLQVGPAWVLATVFLLLILLVSFSIASSTRDLRDHLMLKVPEFSITTSPEGDKDDDEDDHLEVGAK